MKKYTLFFTLLLSAFISNAQLYSSGNNLISGNNVGIGTNAPIYTLESRQFNNTDWCIRTTNTAGTSRSAFRIQNEDSIWGQLDFFKFGKNYGGTFMGISRNNMGGLNSLTGPFVLNCGARMVFGTSLVASPYTQTPRFMIDSFGKINIGAPTDLISIGTTTIAPMEKLHVNGTGTATNIKITNATMGHTTTDGLDIRTTGNTASIINRENSTLGLGTNNTNRMTIDAAGNVIIGSTTTPAGYKLYVETGILTEKVKVAVKTSANWADYVFADNYELQPLKSVEQYIQKNKHLPGIPSAEQVVESGLDLASMDAKLLEKIEELTLHMIKMEKQLDQLKAENEQLKKNSSNAVK